MPDNHSSSAAPNSTAESSNPTLVRTMGLWALVIYGVGDMLGSGIYALIGKVAGTMGNAAWLAFIASMVAALLTGLSYASLGSRYPRAAGVAFVTQRAFGFPFLSYLVGLAVVASGLTSFATQSRAFSGYFLGLLGRTQPGTGPGPLPEVALPIWIGIILAFILVLTFINFWGMRESIWLNILCTFIEVAGVFIIIAVGIRYWGSVNYFEVPPVIVGGGSTPGVLSSALVLQGAILTFYAFVGFEDMINVSEEVKNPRRNFPIAVMLALAIVTVLYIAVSITAVSVVSYAELGKSTQPLVDVVQRAAPGFPKELFSFIALFAITNTALLNYIMGSRLIYGMARQGFVPRFLGTVHAQRRTPHYAIFFLMLIVTALALAGDIKQLASATSALLLGVFIIVNASLIVLHRRPEEPKGAFEIPSIVPLGGILACAAILWSVKPEPDKLDPRLIAGILLAGIGVLYLIARPRNITEETISEISDEIE